MCVCPRGSVFLDAIDTSLKEKTIPYRTKVFERAIEKVGGPENMTAIVTENASNYMPLAIKGHEFLFKRSILK